MRAVHCANATASSVRFLSIIELHVFTPAMSLPDDEAANGGGFPQLQAGAMRPAADVTLGTYRMTPMENVWARNTRDTLLQYSGGGGAIGAGAIIGITTLAKRPSSPIVRGGLVASGAMLGVVAGALQSANVWFPKLLALGEASPLARKAKEVQESGQLPL